MPAVRAYRFYLLDEDDHIVGVRLHELDDERLAEPMARRILRAERESVVVVEAWDLGRRLCRVRRGWRDNGTLFVLVAAGTIPFPA